MGVVYGRGLVRRPYGRDDRSELAFSYKEPSVTDKDLLWAGGAIIAACSIAKSMVDIGWPTAMSGHVCGRVEGFETAEGGKKGDKVFGPGDTELVESKIEELGMAGINAVAGLRDLGDVFVWNGMTAARAERNDPNALFEVSLPYQLFASRLSALLFALKPSLAGLSAEQVAATVKKHVSDWIPAEEEDQEGEQLAVQVRPQADNPTALEMAVTITPPQTVLPGGVPVVMGYRLN